MVFLDANPVIYPIEQPQALGSKTTARVIGLAARRRHDGATHSTSHVKRSRTNDGRLDSVGRKAPRDSESGCAGRLLRPMSSWVSPVYGWCLFVPGTRDFGGQFSRAVGADLRNARTRDERDDERTRGRDSSALLRIGSRILTLVSG